MRFAWLFLLVTTPALARDAGPPADAGLADAGVVDAGPIAAPLDPLARARAIERAQALERLSARTAELEQALGAARAERDKLVAETAAEDVRLAGALEDARLFEKELAGLEAGTAAADARYDKIIARQKAAASRIHEALSRSQDIFASEQRSRLAIARAERADITGDDLALQPAIAALDARIAKLGELVTKTQETQRETWYRVAHTWNDLALRFNTHRQAHVDRLSRAKASEVGAISSKQGDDFRVEVDMLTGLVRFHNEDRLRQIREHDFTRQQWVAVITALVEILLILLVSAWLWRRASSFREPLRRALQRRFRSPRSARLFGSTWSLLEAAVPSAFVMIIATVCHQLLGRVGPQPEVRFVGHVIVWIAFARLLSQTTHRLILQVVRRHTPVSIKEALKILRSVRVLMRYTLLHAFLVIEIVEPLGVWLLGGLVRAIAFLGYLPIAVLLLARWQDEIAAGVQTRWPESRLNKQLQDAGRARRFALSVPAIFLLLGSALGALGHDFLNGFESTRRALAYLLRLQFERETRGTAGDEHPPLPDEVAAKLEPRRVCEPAFLVDRFEFRRTLRERLERFPNLGAGRGNSLLVRAEQGMGRTTWLEQMRKATPDGVRALHFSPTARITSAGGLLRGIGELVGEEMPPGIPSCDAVAERFADQKTVIYLDGIQWLFLRTIGGHEAIDALAELITATREWVYWVATITEPAYHYLQQVRDIRSVFPDRQDLKPWTEKELHNLILRRVHHSELKISFQDSVVRGFEGLNEASHVVETQEGFIRLLWDFSKGNPSVAQHFWYRSLVHEDDGSLTVRPIAPPGADQLDKITEAGGFVLATIYLHNALNPSEISRALNLPRARVDAEIAAGLSRGYLTPHEMHPGKYEISVPWWEAATRYLTRKKLTP
jgi:hypothetical protein